MTAEYSYQVPPVLFEAADKPIGVLPVRMGQIEIAKTSLSDDGVAVMEIPKEIHRKILLEELRVRTLHYRIDETCGGAPKSIKIVCLYIVLPRRRSLNGHR